MRENSALLLFMLLLFAASGVQSVEPPQSADAPAKGVLLVASESMPDPRFQKTVILLLEHDAKGTLGLVLNRRTPIQLSEALSELELADNDHALFWGGPVTPNVIMLLLHGEAPTGQHEPVLDNVFWSADEKVLQQALSENKTQNSLRVFFGNAGWAPGQLAAELRGDGWALFQADVDVIFTMDPDKLWDYFMAKTKQLLVAVPAHLFRSKL